MLPDLPAELVQPYHEPSSSSGVPETALGSQRDIFICWFVYTYIHTLILFPGTVSGVFHSHTVPLPQMPSSQQCRLTGRSAPLPPWCPPGTLTLSACPCTPSMGTLLSACPDSPSFEPWLGAMRTGSSRQGRKVWERVVPL